MPGATDNLRSVTTFEELDALSSRELHDRAVKRAEHRLDIPFFWRLVQEGTAADAAGGDIEGGDAQVAHWSRQMLEVLRNDDAALDARRPIYLDYLMNTRSMKTRGIARIRPSGGFAVQAAVDPAARGAEIGAVAFEMALIREIPDTALADRFDGEPMVQSFLVTFPGAAAAACGSRPPRR